MLDMFDHAHAAFYSSVDTPQDELWNLIGLNGFVDEYLTDSENLKVGSEHF